MRMLFFLRNKSNFGLDLMKRTLITRSLATNSIKLSDRPVKFTQEDFDKINKQQVDEFKKDFENKTSDDPFSPVKTFIKALTTGFFLATICSISYGKVYDESNVSKTRQCDFISAAYDPGYRKLLRTTFPLAASILDLLMKKEEDTVISQDGRTEQAASNTFRETIKQTTTSSQSS